MEEINMEAQVPKELQAKLKIIEKETEFFSKEPRKPHRMQLIMGGVYILYVIGSLLAFKNADYFLMLIFLALAIQGIATYFHQKKLFKMYSGACEIINFYKQNDNQKIIKS